MPLRAKTAIWILPSERRLINGNAILREGNTSSSRGTLYVTVPSLGGDEIDVGLTRAIGSSEMRLSQICAYLLLCSLKTRMSWEWIIGVFACFNGALIELLSGQAGRIKMWGRKRERERGREMTCVFVFLRRVFLKEMLIVCGRQQKCFECFVWDESRRELRIALARIHSLINFP